MKHRVEIYQSKDGQTLIEVKFDQDRVWLTQQHMSTLFNQTKQNISLHINIALRKRSYRESELSRNP